jgi:hypothetical protein
MIDDRHHDYPAPFDPEKIVAEPAAAPAAAPPPTPFHPSARLVARLTAVRAGAPLTADDARLFCGPKFNAIASPEERTRIEAELREIQNAGSADGPIADASVEDTVDEQEP